MRNQRVISMLMVLCMMSSVMAAMFSITTIIGSAATTDRYITTAGAGKKDGSSLDNAWGANTVSFSVAFSSTPLNGTLYVGSGTYNNATVTMATGGLSETEPKRIIGLDTGGGKPIVKGSFVPPTTVPSTKFITISSGVSYITIENFRVENYYSGIHTDGNSSFINVKDFDVYVTNDGIRLNGGGTETNTRKDSNIKIENCKFYYYLKTGIRFENRVEDVQVTNCYADAGGAAYWYAENWPVGFSMTDETSTLAERRITIVDCTAMNSYVDLGVGYWNGDGFTTERGAYNINWIRCKAFGATDGGWDSKGENVSVIDCVAMDNKKNFRFWGDSTTMTNCLAAYAYKRGGSSTAVGLWTDGKVTANFCTFYNNPNYQVDSSGGTVTLNDCILVGNTPYNGSGFIKNRTVDYKAGGTGINPQINVNDNHTIWFYGDGTKYNSALYGKTKGYFWDGSITSPPIPTPAPTPIPTVTPIPTPCPPITIGTVYSENFERFADSTTLRASSGWSGTSSFDASVTLGTNSTKYLIAKPNQIVAQVAFYPVPLNAVGGNSPGKNAKLTAQYRIARTLSVDTSWNYFAFCDSAKLATGSNQTGAALSAGHRPATVADIGQWIYRSSFTGPIAAGDPNMIKGGVYSASGGQWTKVKYEVALTDETGAFITPTVNIYVDGSTTPVLSGVGLLNSVDKIDTLVINNVSSTSKAFYIDDILVEVTAEAVDTPVPTPVTVDKSALLAKIAEANNLLATVNANVGTLEGQYDPSVVAALNLGIARAQGVNNNTGATQDNVDSAVSELQSVMEEVMTNPPTPTPSSGPTVEPLSVVSIDNIQRSVSQNTTDLIYVPIRTTAFIGNVTTIGIDITFDNTKLVYDKTCGLGNIPVSDGTIPTTTWVKHNATAEANANASGKMTILCDNPMNNPYVNSKIIPGTQDILYNLTFKRIAGATGEADISITAITYDTDEYVTYSKAGGTIGVVNGSIKFESPSIPVANITINSNGTITNPYGKIGASIVRANVSGIINPTTDNYLVMVKGNPARFTYYNGVYKFVALVDGSVTTADVTCEAGTPVRLVYGDVNLNNTPDATDVNLLKGAIAGNRTATQYFELVASDVNGDGFVNASDYNTFKGFIAGNLTVLPVESK